MCVETFSKDNLDDILKELSKEYKKLGGKRVPAEIILIGGAAVIENYGFREMTTDIDAIINAATIMKDAINSVGDHLNLPNGWLNDDFKKTDSYSPHLIEVSKPYKTFSNVLSVRIVSSEYLIAMKLKSGRKYKNDLSDVVGILAEHNKRNENISLEQIEEAVNKLYGGWTALPAESVSFIHNVLAEGNFDSIYDEIRHNEIHTKELLTEFENKYQGVVNKNNVNEIIDNINSKEDSKLSILEHLEKIKKSQSSKEITSDEIQKLPDKF